MSCYMFLQGSRKNLTDLILSCCSSMVKFLADAEEVQETFPLTAVLTAMDITGKVLCLIDPVQVCGHRESLSHCFDPL